jgi:rod shape-determining protein MreD
MEGLGPRPAPLTIRAGQALVPLTVTVLCIMLSATPFGTMFGFAVLPAFGFAAIFYWTVNRPDIFPVWSVLALGIFQDLLLGDPLGLWTAVYLVIYGVLLSQRALFVGGAAHSPWMGFAVFAALAGLLAWTFTSLYYGVAVPGGQLAFQMFITSLIYPLIRPIFAIIDKQLRLQPIY